MMTMTNPLRTLTLLALMGLGAAGQKRTVVKPKDTGVGLKKPVLMEADIQSGDTWSVHIPIRVRAMVLASDRLFVAGPPDVIPDDDPAAAFEGRKGGDLWAVSAETGKKIDDVYHTDAPPVYDGLIAAGGSLYLSTTGGTIYCFGANGQ